MCATSRSPYVAAETGLWLTETTAANDRRGAENLALADFRGADYAAKAVAIADIDTALELPWTEYLAGRAAAESAWWTNHERANFLALSAAINAADLAYETTVFGAVTTASGARPRPLTRLPRESAGRQSPARLHPMGRARRRQRPEADLELPTAIGAEMQKLCCNWSGQVLSKWHRLGE